MKAFLSEANGAAPPEEWVFHCIRLAPNAPEQNPVEDVWLQGKQLLRKFSRLCKNFKAVKVLFELFLNFQTFIFHKAFIYDYCSCPI
jgi:transposase